jgi:hypothetical protein
MKKNTNMLTFSVIFILSLFSLFVCLFSVKNTKPIVIQNNNSTNTNDWNPLNKFDVLLNPYTPPYRDTYPYLQPVSTNIGYVSNNFSQIGILTPKNSTNKDNILPLMGRPLFVNRNKFQYYTISNQHNNIKLPIIIKGKNALNEYGVDEIFSKDSIFVEGQNEEFIVTRYETNFV